MSGKNYATLKIPQSGSVSDGLGWGKWTVVSPVTDLGNLTLQNAHSADVMLRMQGISFLSAQQPRPIGMQLCNLCTMLHLWIQT